MKFTIEIDVEDVDQMKIYVHAMDMYCAIIDARSAIRERIKYGENVSDAEEKALERIREALHIGAMDD